MVKFSDRADYGVIMMYLRALLRQEINSFPQ
jgi:hypothetical protein